MELENYREVSGQYYGTPKEVWGFSMPARKGTPRQVADATLRANSAMLKLDPRLRDLDVRKVKTTVSGSHVIYSQSYSGIPIHRAYVTVHMDRNNRVGLLSRRSSHPVSAIAWLQGVAPDLQRSRADQRARAAHRSVDL